MSTSLREPSGTRSISSARDGENPDPSSLDGHLILCSRPYREKPPRPHAHPILVGPRRVSRSSLSQVCGHGQNRFGHPDLGCPPHGRPKAPRHRGADAVIPLSSASHHPSEVTLNSDAGAGIPAPGGSLAARARGTAAAPGRCPQLSQRGVDGVGRPLPGGPRTWSAVVPLTDSSAARGGRGCSSR